MGAQASIGFFGKLPCNGDFIQRRMPEGFLDVWDPWLQGCIHGSRQTLGEAWLDVYLTSPVWRFVLSESVCGSGAYAGVVAPSMDRVGRYYPLTAITQIDVDEPALEFAMRNNEWFHAVEGVLLHALEDPELEVDGFSARLEETTQYLSTGAGGDARAMHSIFLHSPASAHTAARAPIFSAAELQLSIVAFASRELQSRYRPLTCWWTDGSQASVPSWLTLRGLPAPEQFAALLDGQWVRHGWQNVGDLAAPPTPQPMPVASATQSSASAAPAPVRRATFPPGQLTAIETNHAAFVDRPDLGLWALAASHAPEEDPTALRLVADCLQQLGPAGSLTALVEAVRRALNEVQQELRRLEQRDVQRIVSQAHVVALLVVGAECAVVSAGETLRIRVRGQQIEWLSTRTEQPRADVDKSSLLDLFDTSEPANGPLGSAQFVDVDLDYEATRPGECWILGARSPLKAEDDAALMALASSGMPITMAVIADSLPHLTADERVPPLMTVEL